MSELTPQRLAELHARGFTDERVYSCAEWAQLEQQLMGDGELFSDEGMGPLLAHLQANKVEISHPLVTAPYTVRWRRRPAGVGVASE